MGLFSKLFQSPPKPEFETRLGVFIRTYSKRGKNLWLNNDSNGVSITVRGTETEPYPDHLNLIGEWSKAITALNKDLTKKFKREFSQAELEHNFNEWQERFKLVAIEVITVLDDDDLWSATFEDKQKPFAHFTIFIENMKINPDFAIDT